jgi:hypothetical protein
MIVFVVVSANDDASLNTATFRIALAVGERHLFQLLHIGQSIYVMPLIESLIVDNCINGTIIDWLAVREKITVFVCLRFMLRR